MEGPAQKIQSLFSHGAELLKAGSAAAALPYFEEAQSLIAPNAQIMLYTGTALHELERYEEAVSMYGRAIAISPGSGELYNNCGNSLLALGRFSEAAASFTRAAELLPTSPVPLSARATSYLACGWIAEAEKDCRTALMLDASFPPAHWNLALTLLTQGKYSEGWQEYEWRWKKPDFTSPVRHSHVPQWDGSPLQGRSIVLHAEQGFGDAIQFVRYASLVAQCGGSVVVECHPPLVELIKSVRGVEAVVPFGAPLPPFSSQAPLLSLPGIFNTTAQDIPSQCPYLEAPVTYRKKWHMIHSPRSSSLNVGVVWAGKKFPDPLRSCSFSNLAPLFRHCDVLFYSLQMGSETDSAKQTAEWLKMTDLTCHINDFADTAALVEQLDLVISVDTAVAHLSAALGKPVFLMLPYAADWRWMADRIDSPWYPTIHIFRQKRPGIWDEVINDVNSALMEHICSLRECRRS